MNSIVSRCPEMRMGFTWILCHWRWCFSHCVALEHLAVYEHPENEKRYILVAPVFNGMFFPHRLAVWGFLLSYVPLSGIDRLSLTWMVGVKWPITKNNGCCVCWEEGKMFFFFKDNCKTILYRTAQKEVADILYPPKRHFLKHKSGLLVCLSTCLLAYTCLFACLH